MSLNETEVFFRINRCVRMVVYGLAVTNLWSGTLWAVLPSACPITAPANCNSSATSKCWEIVTNGETLGGGSGEFCAAANDGTYVTGTVTRYIYGINRYSIISCTGNVADCPAINGTSRYGIEIENAMLAMQPISPAETLPLVQVAAGSCPSTAYTGNWFWGHLSSANVANNATQSGFGTFTWDAVSIPARPQVTEFFNMSTLTTFGSTISLRAGEACGDTIAGVQSIGQSGDSADQRGGLYFTPAISTLNGERITLMYTSSDKVAIGFPRVAITYKADLNGAYAGVTWAADSSGLSDINVARVIVNAVATSASGIPFSAPDSGTTGGVFADGSTTYTMTISDANSPRDGMVSGTLSDGTNPATNIACQAALNVSSGRNVMVCIAPSTTDNTKSRHFLLATQKAQPGSINIAQPFGCPCDTNGRYKTLNSSNACVTDVAGPLCTASTYGGFTKLEIGANNEAGRAIAVDSNATTGLRKIVVGGSCNGKSTDSTALDADMNSCLARYFMDGTLDTSFNTTGYRSDNQSSASGTFGDRINALKILGDGSVLAAGQLGTSSSSFDIYVAKFTESGVPATFGTSGKTVISWGGSIKGECDSSKGVCSEAGWDLTLDETGNIYVAGDTQFYNSTNGTRTTGSLVKLTSTGTLTTKKRAQADAAFATNGMRFYALLYDDSKLYAGGYIDDGGTSNRDSIIVRYDTSLNLDSSYNSSGYNRFAVRSATDDVVWAMSLDSSGRLIVAGGNTNFNTANMFIARLSTSGALDTTFDGDGIFILCDCGTNNKLARWNGTACAEDDSITAQSCDNTARSAAGIGSALNPRAVFVQPDGKIVVAGGASGYFRAARFTLDESNNVRLDSTFASASPVPGFFQTSSGEASIQPFINATILPYGQILFTGMVNSLNLILTNLSY